MFVDLLLYNPDGTEALPETGRFGTVASGPRRQMERVAYELLLEVGSVCGRTAGTGLTEAVRGAANNMDVIAAFAQAAELVLGRLAREAVDAGERVAGIFLTNVTAAEGVAALDVTVVLSSGAAESGPVVVTIPPG